MKSLRTNLSKLKSTSAYDVDAAKKLEKVLKAKTVSDIEQATGIVKPEGMSDAKYRQIIAASQTAARSIKGLEDSQVNTVTQLYFSMLQNEKTKDWEATINSGLAKYGFAMVVMGVTESKSAMISAGAEVLSIIGERIGKSYLDVSKISDQDLIQAALLKEQYSDYKPSRYGPGTLKFGKAFYVAGEVAGKAVTVYSFKESFQTNYEQYGKVGRASVYAGSVTALGIGVEAGMTSVVTGLTAGAAEAGGAAAVAAGATVAIVPVVIGAVVTMTFVYLYNNNSVVRDSVNAVGDALEDGWEATYDPDDGQKHDAKYYAKRHQEIYGGGAIQ
jgi:hypothetical protein